VAGHGADYMKIVPSHLASLLEAAPLDDLLPTRTLVLGGEATPIGLAKSLVAAAGDRIVANHYGPTETTIGVATVRLSDAVLDDVVVPIGAPLPNVRLYVLDRSLREVPVGVHGELYVGGAALARGYRGRPELTAERFVADPFTPGGRLYRTGDVVKRRPDGLISFLGRADDQVKVRGYRIEPAEIQAALLTNPAISGAVIVADHERLIAYLVAEDGIPSVTQLRSFLGERLPEYMIPAAFVELTAIPLTGNGKVNRSALPAPDQSRPELEAAYQAPQTPTQEMLAEIWADVLGVDRVGVHDNFFELGGHSLLAIQVVARLRAVGREISVGDLFDHPTVDGLAPLIGARAEAWRTRSAVEIRRGTGGATIFFVHSGTGNVTDYSALAAHLGDEHRVLGLQARGLVDEEAPLTTVEEMARAYLEEVRHIQPEGPYLFAGWSMGGYVALEMARQAGGADVFMVGPPLHRIGRRRRARHLRKRALRLVRELTAAIEEGTGLRPSVEEQLLAAWTLDEDGAAAVRAGDPATLRAGRVGVLNTLASAQYRTLLDRRKVRHDGRVVLFLPQEDSPRIRQATLEQWLAIVPDTAELVPAPGTHFSLIRGEEGARFAGEWLRDELARRAGAGIGPR
ncbi:alpha/beta fold hydrolase, partial [Dactylosporangium sp. NPDC051541]|uniref:alpha/beta fold hydrolase n=1 Tax=Dactylosporangium sp. NPDC051541 TaxID=3363977 RepID=UPI00379FA3DB